MNRNERIAHDLICVIKYGSIGGNVSANEIKRLLDYMERAGLVQREVPAIKISPPTIRLPSTR